MVTWGVDGRAEGASVWKVRKLLFEDKGGILDAYTENAKKPGGRVCQIRFHSGQL